MARAAHRRVALAAAWALPGAQAGDPGHVYLAALDATGAHVYTRDLHPLALRGIASGGPIAVSALCASRGPSWIALDSTGPLILPEAGGSRSRPGRCRNGGGGSTRRVDGNVSEAVADRARAAYPFLVSRDPGL